MAALLSRRLLSPWWALNGCRPLSVSAALGAKAQTKASSLDPVQQLFLEKLKEYKTKSEGVGRERGRWRGEQRGEGEGE